MKIFTTEITQDLTKALVKKAKEAHEAGKKVYYIVPSSLSFEKERDVLEYYKKEMQQEEVALFDLLVTRFKQLPYYFDKPTIAEKKIELSAAGEAMLFRRVLSQLSDEEIPSFARLKTSSNFIEKLVDLRQELISANLSADDLSEQQIELSKIFSRFDNALASSFISTDSFSCFVENIKRGKFTAVLQNVTIIIAGFTRFSAQEEALISALDHQVFELIIGTYASKNALLQRKNVIGVYHDSVQMIENFSSKVEELSVNQPVNEVYSKLTRCWEEENDFLLKKEIGTLSVKNGELKIWNAENMLAEVEMLAKNIRRFIATGARFKDFTVLLGSVSSYHFIVQQVFERYEIPFFISQQESMRHHPLLIFLEALQAIKQKNWQKEDVISLLKTQLYTTVNITLQSIDSLEFYLQLHQIRGKKQFSTAFTEENFPNFPSDVKEKEYHENLSEIEKIREELLGASSPLQLFLNQRPQAAQKLLQSFTAFLETSGLSETMVTFYDKALKKDKLQEADQHLQVWALFNQLLKEFQAIFSEEKMSVKEFLEILLAGLKNQNYRQVPAAVDVVQVRDYELVEPRSNDFVYVLGLTASNFPRVKHNTTLLSDEDREEINQKLSEKAEHQFIEPLETTNHHKSLFTILSLLNAANKRLILSTPQIFDNQEDQRSPLLQLLMEHTDATVKETVKSVNLEENIEHIGNLHATLTNLLIIESQLNVQPDTLSPFWSRIFEILKKESRPFRNLLNLVAQDIQPAVLKEETLFLLYPSQLRPSVSAFETFEDCEYHYFLDYSLHLRQFEEIDLKSQLVGNYFHSVFELLMREKPSLKHFDETLTQSLQEIDSRYARIFKRNALSRFTWLNLHDIVAQSAVLLKKSIAAGFVTRETEANFKNFRVSDLALRGKIDRVEDWGEQFVGAVDYKSSAITFDLKKVYEGRSLQLLTYLDVLQNQNPEKKIWGALYLQLQNPTLRLSSLDQLSDIPAKLLEKMEYRGILNTDAAEEFSDKSFIYGNVGKTQKEMTRLTGELYSSDDLQALIEHTEEKYRSASAQIRSGHLEINPASLLTDKSSVYVDACKFCPFKSICRFEGTRHPSRRETLLSKAEILEEIRKKHAKN